MPYPHDVTTTMIGHVKLLYNEKQMMIEFGMIGIMEKPTNKTAWI